METTIEKIPQHYTLECIDSIFYSFWKLYSNTILEFKKESSEFVDHHGKQVLNFQLSLLLYSLVLVLIAVPTFLITLLIMFPLSGG
jgi:uncharacterized Tic20 family protein